MTEPTFVTDAGEVSNEPTIPTHSYVRDDGQAVIEVGPWGVYDCYCMKCGVRHVGVAPVVTESVELWECKCGAWAVTHHPHEDAA